MSDSKTMGVHHVGLTVPDIHATRTFFEQALGFRTVAERPAYPAVFVSDGTVMLTLWQAEDPEACTAFDRKRNVGLHHLALRVADHPTLEALGDALAARDDVQVEFPPEALGDTQTRHMMLAVPGGVRLELVAPKVAS